MVVMDEKKNTANAVFFYVVISINYAFLHFLGIVICILVP